MIVKITIYGTDDTRYNMFENGIEVVYGFELPAENNWDHYIPARTEVEITMDEEYQEDYSHIMVVMKNQHQEVYQLYSIKIIDQFIQKMLVFGLQM